MAGPSKLVKEAGKKGLVTTKLQKDGFTPKEMRRVPTTARIRASKSKK